MSSPTSTRNVAIDSYRGFVMLLMMGEVLELARVAKSFPANIFWQIAAFNQSHVAWVGMSLHDMIQPSFSFLVGVALPYSVASRLRGGQSFPRLLLHTVMRSLTLVALGIFLRSTHSSQTYFTFEDTLTQIGLGFTFLFLIYFAPERSQWIIFSGILLGYWLVWALFPVGSPEFSAHWNKSYNFGVYADRWFLNLFPREHPFVENAGGYLTWSFVPTLGTMILGLIAGRWWKAAASNAPPFRKLILTGLVCTAVGTALHYAGICPIVKRIWTPSWVLFSGGLCFLTLVAFSWLIDVKQNSKLAFPLVVIGRNSITAYVMAELCRGFFEQSLYTNMGHALFRVLGDAFEPLLMGTSILALYWLVLYWMYRRSIFLRI